MPIVSRHDPNLSDYELKEMDVKQNEKYDQSFTVLMWEFELGEIEKKYGAM